MATIPLTSKTYYQSPNEYLQATGSTGNDNTANGLHLRWAFCKDLGANHLPKGNYAATGSEFEADYGYNKDEDFVKIYRAQYNTSYPTSFSFAVAPVLFESGSERRWSYTIAVTGLSDVSNVVFLKFTDVSLYDSIRTGTNPSTSAANSVTFLKSYTGPIEIGVSYKLAFKFSFLCGYSGPTADSNDNVKVELISNSDIENANEQVISCRKQWPNTNLQSITGANPDVEECENIQYIRIQTHHSTTGHVLWLKSFAFETYQDFITGKNAASDWTDLGNFALSLNDTDVYALLEDSGRFVIDKKWPKYRDANTTSGEFTVNKANYTSRWSLASNGLKAAVTQYFTLSQSSTNPIAIDYLPSEASDDEFNYKLSYLEMLKLVSLDYHAARMLGLGYIDTPSPTGNSTKFVYVMRYLMGPSASETHLFMSLPTARNQPRLPDDPVQLSVEYGINVENGTPNGVIVTDENGYSLYSPSRFVNLRKQDPIFKLPLEDFFATSDIFCSCDKTKPVLFGIKYRKQGESNWRKPELSFDRDYVDLSNLEEVVPIPDHGEIIYTHEEWQEGIHGYAIYGINWFSRPSGLSNTVLTDNTQFTPRNSLLPPLNFAVQLIQPENPLILTTSNEQTLLDELITSDPTGDHTIIRATFDYNHNHIINYQQANKAEFFFKENPALIVKGKIDTVTSIDEFITEVTTKSYTIESSDPEVEITPNLLSTDVSKFTGSYFAAGGRLFEITEAIQTDPSGENPIFRLKKIRDTQAIEVFGLENVFTTVENFISPSSNDLFSTTENLLLESQWNKLSKDFALYNFSLPTSFTVSGSTGNDGAYDVKIARVSGSSSDIYVTGSVPANSATGVVNYTKQIPVFQIEQATKSFVVKGDVTSELSPAGTITVSNSTGNNGTYTISSLNYLEGKTYLKVTTSIPSSVQDGLVKYSKSALILAASSTQDRFTVQGQIAFEIAPVYQEFKLQADGFQSVYSIGGIYEQATVAQILDGGSPTGVYIITFNTYQLFDSLDEDMEWYKGIVRVTDTAAVPEKRVLDVWTLDRTGSTLVLTVFDPNYLTDPIIAGATPSVTNVWINFHPSYRVYFYEDSSATLDENHILPEVGAGSKITFMGARLIDTTESGDPASDICPPSPVIAQELIIPIPPEDPEGPDFTTRPDFYGKATYTFDTTVVYTEDHIPYALIFYKGNETSILNTLYKKETINELILSNLPDRFTDLNFKIRWNELVNGIYDTSTGLFNEYDSFTFPLPDNDVYSTEDPTEPGETLNPFVDVESLDDIVVGTYKVIDFVKLAINNSFSPLTKVPALYSRIQSDYQTRSSKPVIRDSNGKTLLPTDTQYDPFPMITKFDDGDNKKVRYCDYNLDGATKNFYFYFAVEINNKFELSDRSEILGPIQVVNSYPAEQPSIKKVITQTANPLLEILPAIRFEINNYITSEGITKYNIYRATSQASSLSIRTMSLAATIDVGAEVIDTFSDVPNPLFGDTLFYSIQALRLIKNEFGVEELIPSLPSKIVMANLIDVINPEAPIITYTSDSPTGIPETISNVELSWPSTCYNGTYYLYKMNNTGNWVKIYQVKSNDTTITFEYPDPLPKQDDALNTVYNRFKVVVENSSGLMSLSEKILII